MTARPAYQFTSYITPLLKVSRLCKLLPTSNCQSLLKLHKKHLIPKPPDGQDQDENKKITDKPVALPDGQLRTYQAAQRVTIRCSQSGDFEQISLLNI